MNTAVFPPAATVTVMVAFFTTGAAVVGRNCTITVQLCPAGNPVPPIGQVVPAAATENCVGLAPVNGRVFVISAEPLVDVLAIVKPVAGRAVELLSTATPTGVLPKLNRPVLEVTGVTLYVGTTTVPVRATTLAPPAVRFAFLVTG